MTRNKALVSFFSSGLQTIAVQVLGGVFFYFISIYLSKESFGIISWLNALCLFIFTLLGFGLEQVVVRRIAASRQSNWAAAAFVLHSAAGFLTGLLFVLLLYLFKGKQGIYGILPWFFMAQGLIYTGVPLKQFLNAHEQFTPYGIIAIISNAAKILAACVLMRSGRLNVNTIVFVLTGTAAFELCCLITYVSLKTTFSFKLRFNAYLKLLKEALPQYISVIFDMSLSRIDWLLLGMLSSNIVLADYSFAYRAYELARLPVIIIAPVILPRLARMAMANNKLQARFEQHMNAFNTVELFLAMLIPLVLNILWVPLVGLVTGGKYGGSNAWQFLILSLCIPQQFFINLLWSLSFSARKYKQVTTVTIICAAVNVVLNLIMIPRFSGAGASAAFLITNILQACLYYRLTGKYILKISLRPLWVFMAAAFAAWFISAQINAGFLIRLLLAVGLYVCIALLTKQLKRQHITDCKQLLSS